VVLLRKSIPQKRNLKAAAELNVKKGACPWAHLNIIVISQMKNWYRNI
jgi:hypothetical protein